MERPYVEVCSEEDRDRWLAERKNGIGASEVAALLGEDPYTTREELIRRKRGEAPDFDGNRATRLGHYLEPWILEEYGDLQDECVHPWKRMLRSPDTTHLFATPDGYLCRHGDCMDPVVPIQVKSTSQNWMTTRKYEGAPPLHVRIQVQAELAVTGLEQVYVVALHLPSREIFTWCFGRHEGVIQRIRTEVERAWEEEICPALTTA